MNPKPVEVYRCGKCELIHFYILAAKKCCVCPTCGGESNGLQVCGKCVSLRCEKIERERFEKAEKIPHDQYTGECFCIDDKYYFGDFEEECESEDFETLPEYFWDTRKVYPSLDGVDVIENLKDAFWVPEEIEFVDEQEFVDFIAAWVKKQKPLYVPDYKKAIVPTKEFREQWDAMRKGER